MVPRTQIRALEEDATLGDALRYFRDIPHARFPVYVDSLDRITGVVAIKELLTYMAEHASSDSMATVSKKKVIDFAKPAFMVPDSKPLNDLLADFKRTRQQMAIVVDEYGGTEGIITLEDLLEEIVGEIDDEHDQATDRAPVWSWGGTSVLAGRLSLDEVYDSTKLRLPEGDYETLAGFVLDQLGHIPEVGDGFTYENWSIDVLEMDRHRVASVRLVQTIRPDDEPEGRS